MSQNITEISKQVAAIDLGSNSFHMVVAKVINQDLQIVSRHKQRVRLALGLDAQNNLDNASIERGLECLAMFAERLQGFEVGHVRIAATHTLRIANNAHIFLQRAKAILPFSIEIIPGEEEARLIYSGVAHTQTESSSKLVVDIGGGSTELIIGEAFTPKLLNSTQMGCVSYTKKYFANGKLSTKNFSKAILSAQQRLEALSPRYRKSGWEIALGSSGTIKAIKEVLVGLGYDDGVITLKRLHKLIDKLCEFNHIDNITFPGLTVERQPVFAAGVAILTAIFDSLSLDEMHCSTGALREGLLYEMEDQFQRSDIRMRTAENLAQKHSVDINHADNVRVQARDFLYQLHDSLELKKKSKLYSLIEWSALLHEVGLSINYQAFHKHSSYILQHTTMPGFNSEEQLVLATLARFQRKQLKLQELPEFSLYKKKHIEGLIRVLRLAIILNGQRNEEPKPPMQIVINKGAWILSSTQKDWLLHNKLLDADLQTEQRYWQGAGWVLEFS
ncbi:exopolyphosphatase [Vibrio sp. 10N.286.49.C2]|uniref:exopolyphosphatase n=1 Tax=unclassified Vibrio TaxID=2614977 RepID=UPI000C82F5C2|nr:MULTISPECIES: exopolyphosphatase [unclassified Vibrio]PMH33341.1 exopolyphosphatase [Vibrio sp. 10N.286.49.C2]PMH48238.1 exopolyphosphatase [Vibrio sp. 10N.286.49.B1]PMH80402.1 exopolyphosphatase [Vibrio sp. 10N.286.48.B7]